MPIESFTREASVESKSKHQTNLRAVEKQIK
jgi:hypothetical protein